MAIGWYYIWMNEKTDSRFHQEQGLDEMKVRQTEKEGYNLIFCRGKKRALTSKFWITIMKVFHFNLGLFLLALHGVPHETNIDDF